MSATYVMQPGQQRRQRAAAVKREPWDRVLLLVILALFCLGIVMVASSSIGIAERTLGQPFYYLNRQLIYAAIGALLSVLVLRIKIEIWERAAPLLLLLAFMLLLVVLIPGVGTEVKGSTRWLRMGLFQVQVSEICKFLVLVYLAGYLVRRGEEVRTTVSGFLKPMAVLGLAGLLLLLEPDFGTTVVLVTTGLGMMFLAGVRLWQFGILISVVGAGMSAIIFFSPYRWQRVISFLNPWEDPFKGGFQLTQSLIAFGRGEWSGVGLGGSVQKLFYLPEAHTDFLLAVIAEELGLLGVVLVIALFVLLVWRAFVIAALAERNQRYFSAYLAYGLGIWMGLQAFINIGVNMGVLPTKGLTLPLMSYGGSSLVVTLVALALLLRIGYEATEAELNSRPLKRRRR